MTAGGNYLGTATPGNDNYGISPGGPSVSGTLTTQHTSTPAVFGGIYFDIMPKLTLGGEARYQWDTISAQTKFPAPPPATAGLLSATYGSFSPRVTLDYNMAPGSVIYALWSRGYRPGGFNTQVLGQPASVLTELSSNIGVNVDYLQEKMDNFEGGFKNTWWDGRIQTAIGGYFDEWRNGQVTNTITVQTPTGVQQISATQNVGAVNLYGIEATGAAAITKQFTVTGNADYVHSKILSYIYTPNGTRIDGSTNVNGKQFFGTPVGWTFTITPQYTDHLAGDWDWFARVDWRHRGRFYPDATNVDWIPATNKIDLHLGVQDKNIKLEAFALNLNKNYNFEYGEVGTDPSCCSVGAATINAIRMQLPLKRQFGLRATYDF
jgi:iron complex outermembrane receptor protein